MLIALLILCGCGAWFISTIAAGGAATLLVPVLSFLLGAQLVAPVLSVASACANPSRAWLFRRHIDWPVLSWLLPGSLLGAALGSWTLTRLDPRVIEIIIGLFLLAMVLKDRLGYERPAFRMQRPLFLPLAATASFLSGLVGVTGPILNPFLLNYGLEKETLIATKALNSLLMQMTKISSYTLLGLLTLKTGLYGLLLGMGALVGIHLARGHLLRIERQRFRTYTLVLMGIAGLLLLARGLGTP